MKRLLAGVCILFLTACAVYKDKEGNTHYEVLPAQPAVAYVPAPPPPPPQEYYPPSPPPAYYAPSPPPAYYAPAQPPTVIIEGGGGGGDHDRAKHVQANCNTAWTGCSNVCNTVADPNQRALCISNCNNARNQCLRKNM